MNILQPGIRKVAPYVLITVVIVSLAAYAATRPPRIAYGYDQVRTSSITEEVSATGMVKAAASADLSFDRSGKINRVYAQTGDAVRAGQILVSLDNADAAAQLAQAQAALDKQNAGGTPEYIAGLEASLDKAKADLSAAEGDIPGVETSNLVSNAYEDMVANLQSVQNNLSSALSTANDILGIDNPSGSASFNTYVPTLDYSKLNVAKDQYTSAKITKVNFDVMLNAIDGTSTHADIDHVALQGENALLQMKNVLFDISDLLDTAAPYGAITPTVLTTMKTNVQTARTNITARYAALITQAHAIDAARNNYYSLKALADKAQAALQDAQNPPRAVDIAGFQAAVDLALANYNKTVLRAPFDGIVSRQEGKIGASIVPNVPIVSVISGKQYQVEMYVSESDISKIKTNNAASITLDNLGNAVSFDAKVISVAPAAEALADGSMAYKIKLQFNHEDERIKAGLTANVKIVTAEKDNVVVIPERDVVQKNGDYFVMVKNSHDQPAEQKVALGLQGNDGTREIISGLKSGDMVVSFGAR